MKLDTDEPLQNHFTTMMSWKVDKTKSQFSKQKKPMWIAHFGKNCVNSIKVLWPEIRHEMTKWLNLALMQLNLCV